MLIKIYLRDNIQIEKERTERRNKRRTKTLSVLLIEVSIQRTSLEIDIKKYVYLLTKLTADAMQK